MREYRYRAVARPWDTYAPFRVEWSRRDFFVFWSPWYRERDADTAEEAIELARKLDSGAVVIWP